MGEGTTHLGTEGCAALPSENGYPHFLIQESKNQKVHMTVKHHKL